MPDQIPEGCIGLKTRLDKLITALANLRRDQAEADPSDRLRYQNLVGAKEREVSQAKSIYNACLNNPPPPPPPPPPQEHIPGVPDHCIPLYKNLNKLFAAWQILKEVEMNGGAADDPDIHNKVGKKGLEVSAARFAYNTCNPPPPPPPKANKPIISTDLTLQPVQKIISWDFVQKKMDEFFNRRTDPPIFRITLDNMHAGSPPASTVTISMIGAVVINGKVGTKYNPITTLHLGELPDGYYFNDINSNKITVSLDPLSPEPITVKINFECNGPEEMLSTQLYGPNMNLTEFYVTLKLSLDVVQGFTPLQCKSQEDNLNILNLDLVDLQREMQNPTTNHALIAKQITAKTAEIKTARQNFITCLATFGRPGTTGFGKLDFLSWIDKIKDLKGDNFEDGLKKYVVVHITTKGLLHPISLDFGGKTQKSMRSKIYGELKKPETRAKLNGIISRWVLGGKGDYDVLPILKDAGKVTINYRVPANKLEPFPDKPTGWPFNSPTPDPQFNLPLPNNLSNIKHIVVLTMENRSFDHMLGYLSLPVNAGGMGRTEVDGLKLNGSQGNTYYGNTYRPFPLAPGDTAFPVDPPHSFDPVYKQINPDINVPGSAKMDGFINELAKDYPNLTTPQDIMGYHTGANVPVYDALVRDFGISDRWFSAHPGPTFCNRFYELTGRLNVGSGLNEDKPPVEEDMWEFSNSSPLTPVFFKTIFDYLTEYHDTIEKGVTWKYYEQNYCFLRFFSKYTFDDTNIVRLDDPLHGFYADAKNGTLPSVSYIDPHYIELPPNANSDGPVSDIKEGQALVQKIVEAVITSPQFTSTLLVITYDEHGGFYDHVPPPAATPFSAEFPIKTYGVRIPAFFISPWVKAGSVFGHNGNTETIQFDTTSILKTIATRFMSKNPPYLGPRYAKAKDLTAVLDSTWRRPRFLPFIRYNFVYNASQMTMDVSGPGATLWQLTKRGTAAQDFSFEQAEGGLVYIRTHVGNLYLTLDVTTNAITNPPAQGFGIRQDVKYHAGQAGVDPKYQLWKLIPVATAGAAKNSFLIANAFFPNKILQPLSLLGGARLVLTDKPATVSEANAWKVSSPLIT